MKSIALPLSIAGFLFAAVFSVYAAFVGFSGKWNTVWDPGAQTTALQMNQAGDKLTGSYTYKNGQISGTVTGDTAKGSWWQEDGARGTFEFTLSRDGNSFKGVWRNGTKGKWDGAWNGTRRD